MKSYLIKFFTALFCLISFSSTASDQALSAQLAKCVQVDSADARLACFDELAKSVSSTANNVDKAESIEVSEATVTAVVPPVVTEPVKVTEAEQVDDFAKEHIKKSEQEQGLESITSVITKLKKLIRGQWQITLENGQKWQQKDTSKITLKVGDTILLKKAMMGAVYLNKEGSHRKIRVKRLK